MSVVHPSVSGELARQRAAGLRSAAARRALLSEAPPRRRPVRLPRLRVPGRVAPAPSPCITI